MSDYESKHFATAVGEFLAWFEALFDHDWEHTKAMMQSPDCIDPDRGTFLNPGCGETHSNWANRDGFVNAYRRWQLFISSADLLFFSQPNPSRRFCSKSKMAGLAA